MTSFFFCFHCKPFHPHIYFPLSLPLSLFSSHSPLSSLPPLYFASISSSPHSIRPHYYSLSPSFSSFPFSLVSSPALDRCHFLFFIFIHCLFSIPLCPNHLAIPLLFFYSRLLLSHFPLLAKSTVAVSQAS